MERNKLCRDASYTVGLQKQRNLYQSSLTFLCFDSPTALFVSQHNLFRTMQPDRAKDLFKGPQKKMLLLLAMYFPVATST